MVSVTRPCADHPIKAHEFVLEHVKVAFNVKTSKKQHLLVFLYKTKSKQNKSIEFRGQNPILQLDVSSIVKNVVKLGHL